MAASAFSFQQSLGFGLSKRISPFASFGRIRKPFFRTSTPRTTSIRTFADGAQSAVEPPEYLSEGERKIFDMIRDGLQPTKLEVQDISGGCGSMYALDVVSDKFKGLPIIKQHRLVNSVLGDEMKKWHGVQLKTKAP